MHQVIKEPTHILNSSLTCINLIFTTQPNLIIESRVHLSLHSNCHHQIIFAKFNLEVVSPPLYEQEIWHYKDAYTELTKWAINEFNCQRAILKSDVTEEADIFNSTILNILRNFIPQEFVVCYDKDSPWLNKKIRALIQEENAAFKNYCNNRSNMIWNVVWNIFKPAWMLLLKLLKKYYHNTVNKLKTIKKMLRDIGLC